MKYLKKQMLILCVALMAVVTALTTMPQEVKAAKKIEIMNEDYLNEAEVWIYKGAQKLYIGDYIRIIENKEYTRLGYGYLTKNGGATYTSSNPSVAQINKTTGKITAKQAGETVITVKYNGKEIEIAVRVVDTVEEVLQDFDFDFKDETHQLVSEIKKGANNFFEQIGEARPKFTTNNRRKIAEASINYNSYAQSWDAVALEETDGVICGKNRMLIYGPEVVRARIIRGDMLRYIGEMDPLYVRNKDVFQVTSISGKGNSRKVIMKLKSKVTDDQIFGIQARGYWDSEIKAAKTAEIPLEIKNMKNGHRYYAIATVKKGSNKITIDTGDLKLKKGVTYQILDESGLKFLEGIAKKDTFKAS